MATNFLPLAATGLQPVQEEYRPTDRWLRRLCLALLADALEDLEGIGRCGGRIARARYGREAWDWFASDADYCFSFTIVCAVLDLNAEATRREVGRRFAPRNAPWKDLARFPRSPWRGSTAAVPAPSGRRAGKYCGRVLR